MGHHEAHCTPQKLLDVTKLAEPGWAAMIGLHEGLERAVDCYHQHASRTVRLTKELNLSVAPAGPALVP